MLNGEAGSLHNHSKFKIPCSIFIIQMLTPVCSK
jgi:hypothetical protein